MNDSPNLFFVRLEHETENKQPCKGFSWPNYSVQVPVLNKIHNIQVSPMKKSWNFTSLIHVHHKKVPKSSWGHQTKPRTNQKTVLIQINQSKQTNFYQPISFSIQIFLSTNQFLKPTIFINQSASQSVVEVTGWRPWTNTVGGRSSESLVSCLRYISDCLVSSGGRGRYRKVTAVLLE